MIRILRAMIVAIPVGAAVWLLTGALAKLIDLPYFRGVIAAHGVFPIPWVWAIAPAVPLVEGGSALLAIWWCFFGRGSRAGWLMAAAFAVLMIYTTILWTHPPPRPAPCGCGLRRTVVEDWAPIVARNLSVTLMLGTAAVLYPLVIGTSASKPPDS